MTISNNLKTRLQVALADPAAADEIETILETPSGGLPDGGTTGQALVKASNDDQDAEWSTISGASEFAELTDLADSQVDGSVLLNSNSSFYTGVSNTGQGMSYVEHNVINSTDPYIDAYCESDDGNIFANMFIAAETTPNIGISIGTANATAGVTAQITAEEIPFIYTQGTLTYNKIIYSAAETAGLTYEGQIHIFSGTEPDQNVVIDWSKVGDAFILVNDTAESVVFEGSDTETFNGSATLTLTTGKMATCVQSTDQVFHCIISP
jgi:hypothetical protein